MTVHAALIFALALSWLPAFSLPGEDPPPVETLHPNGAVHERYEVDEDGQKNGKYERFREDGSREVEAAYRKDELQGRYAEYGEEGELLMEALYSKGRKNGYHRTFDEGVRTLNATYRNDVLHGRWESVLFDESFRTLANYKQGVLDGRFQEFKPLEDWERNASYKDGLLHGKAKISVKRKVVSVRTWDRGLLLELDGRVPYPFPLEALKQELAEAKVVPDPVPGDPSSPDRVYALMRLKAYRALCGLPWQELTLVPEWNDLCDAASEVCEANGGLSHTPDQPPGFDDKRFQEGYRGASSSNLASGGLRGSVDAYMDDSDPSNIDRVGHRRWCLNPAMGKTGFGQSGSYAAMWSMDSSGSGARDKKTVFYPPPGYVPTDMFGERHAWSLQIYSGKVPKSADDLVIEIVRLDDWYQPRGEPLELDWKDINTGGFAGSPCVIFRPVGLKMRPGNRYGVTISVDGGKSTAYEYLVEFIEGQR